MDLLFLLHSYPFREGRVFTRTLFCFTHPQVPDQSGEAFKILIDYLISDTVGLDARLERTFAVLQLAQKYQVINVRFFISCVLNIGHLIFYVQILLFVTPWVIGSRQYIYIYIDIHIYLCRFI